MTPNEIQEALKSLVEEFGPNAYASVSVSTDEIPGKTVYTAVYPKGVCDNWRISAYGETFEEALAALKAEVENSGTDYVRKTTREMALAIITITSDAGSCSDAALRMKFSQKEIEKFGAQAVAEADSLAAGGPFSIVTTANGNNV